MRMHASLVLCTGCVLGFVPVCTDCLDLTLCTVLGFYSVHFHAMFALIATKYTALYVASLLDHAATASKVPMYPA